MTTSDDKFEKYRDLVVDITSTTFDRGAAYTNLIMVGGYAGTFAVWNFSQDHLTIRMSAWVGLLLTLSLAVFILFEVYKMIHHTRHIQKIGKLLSQSKPLHEILSDVTEYEKTTALRNITNFMRVWVISLFIAVMTALAAAVILLWNFTDVLIGSA